jgi:hypothetical protein
LDQQFENWQNPFRAGVLYLDELVAPVPPSIRVGRIWIFALNSSYNLIDSVGVGHHNHTSVDVPHDPICTFFLSGNFQMRPFNVRHPDTVCSLPKICDQFAKYSFHFPYFS